jgi:hypothetical protein
VIRRAVTARDVVGVPRLPPGPVSALVSTLRDRVRRLHGAMAPPPVRILEGLFGMLDHRVLVSLCVSGVPDALDGPTTVADLAARIDADPHRLERLLRFAATRGWVAIDRSATVRPTRVTAFLRTDHPGGWRAWVEFAGGEEVVAGVAALTVDAATRDAFAAANGRPFFAWMAAHPDRGATFDRAMAAGGRLHGLALAAAVDWSGSTRVCDVGGGTGALLDTLVDLVPHLSGTLLDLPDVVARATGHPRVRVVAGDAFVSVPADADTYLLVNVLHDWNDEDAGRILDRVAAAMPAGARILVVDNDRPVVPRDDVALGADVLMAALTDGGHERDPAGFAALAANHGLQLTRSTRLASGDFAHELRR